MPMVARGRTRPMLSTLPRIRLPVLENSLDEATGREGIEMFDLRRFDHGMRGMMMVDIKSVAVAVEFRPVCGC